MNKLILILLTFTFTQCKTAQTEAQKSNDNVQSSSTKQATQSKNNNIVATGAYPLEPGTCKMHGIIKEILPKESKEFLDNNHIQGNVNSSIKIGLFHNNELAGT